MTAAHTLDYFGNWKWSYDSMRANACEIVSRCDRGEFVPLLTQFIGMSHTAVHTVRTAILMAELAQDLDMDDAERIDAVIGALIHDVGKVTIPDSVLLKPGALTEEEWTLMRGHPTRGTELLARSIRIPRDVWAMVRWHHERMDGGGYPDGKKASVLPTCVRALAVLDAFDTLIGHRPYKAACSVSEALDRLHRPPGHLDPLLINMFTEAVRGGEMSWFVQH